MQTTTLCDNYNLSSHFAILQPSVGTIDLNNILKPDTPKLSEDEANSLEGKITLKEAGETLYKMNNNKSPGSSGFTVEFF